MQRMHEESLTKSNRLKPAWKEKRDKTQGRKLRLSAKCPAWLQLLNGKFEIIKDRTSNEKRIFRMTIDSIGNGSIAGSSMKRASISLAGLTVGRCPKFRKCWTMKP